MVTGELPLAPDNRSLETCRTARVRDRGLLALCPLELAPELIADPNLRAVEADADLMVAMAGRAAEVVGADVQAPSAHGEDEREGA
jgi:hypothetical protein